METNSREKRIKKKSKKISRNKMLLIFIVLTLIALISAIVFSKNKKSSMTIDKEILRSKTYAQVQPGDEDIENTDYVKFDAFFLRDLDEDGYAESIRGSCRKTCEEDTLYMDIKVQQNGYLKDGKISIDANNICFETKIPKDNEIKENVIGSNVKEIKFNDLINGTQKTLTGIVRSGDYTKASSRISAIGNNINNYSAINSITLTGTHVDEDGNETPITKRIEFTMDWHGTTLAYIRCLCK